MMRPMPRPMAGLARLTLLEARRTAVGKSVIAAIAIALCLALFMDRIVLTEQARAAVVTYAVIVRLGLVLLIAQAIIANTVRDLHERVVEHFLALPLTPSAICHWQVAGVGGCRGPLRDRGGTAVAGFCGNSRAAGVDIEFRG